MSPASASAAPPRPTVVLLPGLACDGELFRGQAVELAARAPVVLSTEHERQPTIPQMASALLGRLPVAGPAPDLVLVGCSMGGMVALEMHRQAPQRVHGIALLGSTARPDTPELIALRTQACELFAAGRMDEVLMANVMFAFGPEGAGDGALIKRYLAMIRRAGALQLIQQNRAVMARADLRPHLPQVACPVLVACGEADGLTPPEVAREMAALLPNARLALLPGAGHMLTMEQPERVAALLLEWLDGLGLRAPA